MFQRPITDGKHLRAHVHLLFDLKMHDCRVRGSRRARSPAEVMLPRDVAPAANEAEFVYRRGCERSSRQDRPA